jgi:hypothetical protein
MPKEIYIDIDDTTGDFELKLEGFKGKGCKNIAKKFEQLGKVTHEEHLPSYNEAEASATVKAGH